MRVQDKRCGCGAIWTPVSMMSRETRCHACLRREAAALMEARKGEAQPVPIRHHAADRFATGPAVVRPGYGMRALDEMQAKMAAQRAAHVAQVEREFAELMQRPEPIIAQVTKRVDPLTDPLPSMCPSSEAEALAMLKQGWWLSLGATTTRLRAPTGAVEISHDGVTWTANAVSRWAWPPHDVAAGSPGWFHAIRPESP